MRKYGLIFAVVLNAIGLILVTFYFMSLPWLAGDEKLLIWSTSAIKLLNRDLPASSDYALINTSYDQQLIDRFDEFGFPVGNQPITDRRKLSEFFKTVQNLSIKPKYILVDIHFEDSTAYDSELSSSMKGIENLIASSHLDDDKKFTSPVITGINYGLSDYVIGNVFEGVYKYQLIHQNEHHLTPLMIYEDIYEVEAERGYFGVRVGDQWIPNNFIINYRILQKDIFDQNVGFNPINLGELLYLDEKSIEDFLGGKIVILGDFYENDMHETLYEVTAGPLILLNVFLSLVNKDVNMNGLFFVILFLAYTYFSYMAFYKGDYLELKLKKTLGDHSFIKTLAGFVGYLTLFSILSIITFFGFGIHLNVFFLAFIVYAEDKLVSILRR